MKKRIESIILVILVVCCAFVTLNSLGFFATDFSKVNLVYENDGQVRYYYHHLSDNAKIAYTLVLPQAYKHTEKIEIPELNDDEFNALMYAVSYDNPDLICYGRECEIKYENGKYYFYPSYNHSADECEQYKKRFDDAVNLALSGISKSASDYDKELYVHDYLCKICEYEDACNDDSLKASAYNVFVDGKAVCEGYARAAQLLLDDLGIQNYLVTGEATDENGQTQGHMWNIVTIASKNYNLDVTWDDMDRQDDNFSESHTFFNVTDDVISRTHFNITPSANNCVSDDMNYFKVNGILFSDYTQTLRQKISDSIYSASVSGTNSFEIAFTDNASYKKAVSELIDRKKILDILEQTEKQYSSVNYKGTQYVVDDQMYVIKFIFS